MTKIAQRGTTYLHPVAPTRYLLHRAQSKNWGTDTGTKCVDGSVMVLHV